MDEPVERIDHPPHYTFGEIEVIDAIEDWRLGFHLGNVVKYVARAAHKDNYGEDLRKARWYLDRELQRHAGEATLQESESREADS